MSAAPRDFIYQRITRDLSKAIRDGVYGIHERMPSLRRVADHYQVSLATVVQAFACMEAEGLIAARPKSGYYVLPSTKIHLETPVLTRPSNLPTAVNVGQLALSLVNESKSLNLVKLGAAVPEVSLLPVRNLSRILAGSARQHWRDASVYELAQGVVPLRRQIARLMRQAGCRCTPEDIVITNGCLEALALSLRVVARAGDTIAVESPTYFGVLQVMESLGMKALEIATDAETGIDLEALETSLTSRKVRACILQPNHSNPMGSRMPDQAKQRVVALLARLGIPLLEDDVYGPLSYRQPRPKAAKAWDNDGNVLLCSSFSKTIAPGYRIGWVYSEKYREQLLYQKFLSNISTASLPQIALATFLARGAYGRALRQQVQVYRQRMDQLRHWVYDYFPVGTRVSQPTGGFVCWLELPADVDCMALYEKAFARRIAISPGVLFCARGQYRHHIRMSCGAVEGERMRRAIKQLGGLVEGCR